MTFDESVALLRMPERWCDAAAAFVKLGDRRAIAMLGAVVALTEEGLPDRECVRDALQALGVREEALRLAESLQVEEQRMGISLMKSFLANEHIPVLENLAWNSPNPDLRLFAARAIQVQKITPTWEVAMIKLLDSPDLDLRDLAIESLERRFSGSVLAALQRRLDSETDARLYQKLAAVIRTHAERDGGALIASGEMDEGGHFQ